MELCVQLHAQCGIYLRFSLSLSLPFPSTCTRLMHVHECVLSKINKSLKKKKRPRWWTSYHIYSTTITKKTKQKGEHTQTLPQGDGSTAHTSFRTNSVPLRGHHSYLSLLLLERLGTWRPSPQGLREAFQKAMRASERDNNTENG